MTNSARLILLAVALGSALAGYGLHQWLIKSNANQAVGRDFPGFVLETPDGEAISARQFDGQPLIVNLWATWCPPCVREIPALVQFQADFQDQLTVIGVAFDDADAVRDFLPRFDVNYPIAIADPFLDNLSPAIGNDRGALPYTVAVSTDGKIVAVHAGEITRTELDDWAQMLGL